MTEEPLVRRPAVARRTGARASLVPAALGAVALGALVFAGLGASRAARAARDTTALPPLASPASAEPAPLILPPNFTNPPPPTPAPIPVRIAPVAPPPPPIIAAPIRLAPPPVDTGAAERERARLRAPTLIVDLAQRTDPTPASIQLASAATPLAGLTTPTATLSAAQDTMPGPILLAQASPASAVVAPGGTDTSTPSDTTAAAAATAATAASATAASSQRLTGNEGFAARIGGEQVEQASATRLGHLDRLIPQGAVIAAVLETALDSDLPGYARAIVNRDVLSFDGSAVLIPAGSRVIGQYNSGVAQGASRVFILWQRLIRPDGVAIALGSPATDDLGRGGVAGHVNRHFLQRYGGAILLSVLTGGISAGSAALSSGNTVIVGTTNQATGLANEASNSLSIPPTIRTPQGANVRIFVARDLDFTGVGPTS